MRAIWIVPVIASILLSGSILYSAYAVSLTPVEIIDFTGDGFNQMNSPFGVATDSSGNVFVAGDATDNAFKITPGGTITQIISLVGDGLGNTLLTPSAVATDLSGNVFVVGAISNNAFKITPGGTITQIISFGGDGLGNFLSFPQGVATDSSGNVFVTGDVSDNAFKITPGGTITEIIDVTGDGGGNLLDRPFAVATDSSGNVFVAGVESDNAFKITPGGTITQIIDSTGDGAGNTFFLPFGIATDSSGNVFVAGFGSDNVFKITPGGTITEIIDSTGDGGGNLLGRPFAVTTDSSGNVFVTGFGSDNAFKITTPGTCSTSGTVCTITEIIDATGDGAGNTLLTSSAVATDSSGNVFVAGNNSNNVFKIPFRPTECEAQGGAYDHWDKIVFHTEGAALRDSTGKFIPVFTPLDIKVIDDPTQVANLKIKVANFLNGVGWTNGGGGPVNPNRIVIDDVDYTAICVFPQL